MAHKRGVKRRYRRKKAGRVPYFRGAASRARRSCLRLMARDAAPSVASKSGGRGGVAAAESTLGQRTSGASLRTLWAGAPSAY